MKVDSLFSGGGLGDYGLELAGMEITWQVEKDDYCQKILKLRWPHVPKWKDIKQVDPGELPAVDLISGGFPCQPFSVAGKRQGEKDDRNLWPQMFRIIEAIRPAFVLAENVPGLIPVYLDKVLSDLEGIGYSWEAFVVPACAFDAPHRRDRLWIVGYSIGSVSRGGSIVKRTRNKGRGKLQNGGKGLQSENRQSRSNDAEPSSKNVAYSTDSRFERMCGRENKTHEDVANPGLFGQTINEKQTTGFEQFSEDVPNSKSKRLRGGENPNNSRDESEGKQNRDNSGSQTFKHIREWPVEPSVGRVADGIASRLDRLKLLGNGQVVQVVAWIGRRIMEFECPSR